MWLYTALGLLGLAVILLLILLTRARQQLHATQGASDLAVAIAPPNASDKLADFETLADALSDPIILISARHRIMYQNPVARQLWPPLPTGPTSLIEATRVYELDDYAADILHEHTVLPREITLNAHLFRVIGARITRPDDTVGALLILRDISELQRLGRARRDFVANISHELRTPLTAIRLLADTLKVRHITADPIAQKLLNQIGDQTDALTQLTQELYDLTQIESGSMPMRMIPVDLRELVDSVIVRLSPQAERAGLTLRNDVPLNTLGLVDVAQIARVFSNLIHNAIKFTTKGEIVVFAQPVEPSTATKVAPTIVALTPDDLPAEYITLAVRDTGAGIPKEELPRIFERFYKVDRARGQSGTGLGLAIAKHIVEAHGCRIWAESTLSKGATFYFTVPCDA